MSSEIKIKFDTNTVVSICKSEIVITSKNQEKSQENSSCLVMEPEIEVITVPDATLSGPFIAEADFKVPTSLPVNHKRFKPVSTSTPVADEKYLNKTEVPTAETWKIFTDSLRREPIQSHLKK